MSEQTDIASLDWELHDAKAELDVRHRVVWRRCKTAPPKPRRIFWPAWRPTRPAAGSWVTPLTGWSTRWWSPVPWTPSVNWPPARDVERIEADLVVELIEPIRVTKALATRARRPRHRHHPWRDRHRRPPGVGRSGHRRQPASSSVSWTPASTATTPPWPPAGAATSPPPRNAGWTLPGSATPAFPPISTATAPTPWAP